MFPYLLALLLCALPPPTSGLPASGLPASGSTPYRRMDAAAGVTHTCDRCAPGTHLLTACSDTQGSVCGACPQGSFTELWNYLEACLPCGACTENQEVLSQCSSTRDTACRCAPGHRYVAQYEVCVRHGECPSGSGVVSKGTQDTDTRCQRCPRGYYSDRVSALESCRPHSVCKARGMLLAAAGGAWHDSVCTTCSERRGRGAADYLRALLPSFWVHQNIPETRLRRLLARLPHPNRLPPEQGEALGRMELHLLLDTWVLQASPEELMGLTTKLKSLGALKSARRLQDKLGHIQNQLAGLCVESRDKEEVEEHNKKEDH